MPRVLSAVGLRYPRLALPVDEESVLVDLEEAARLEIERVLLLQY